MKTKRIVITGPESTGKTELVQQLAEHYNCSFVPEYAREYIGNLKRSYTYEDVEIIARKQIEFDKKYMRDAGSLLLFDTYLIITKVWFLWVYKKCPDWLLKNIESINIDMFLLCNTDIPWISDPLRENGGKNRQKLFNIYQTELQNYNLTYNIVEGKGENRFKCAKRFINEIL